MHAHLRLTTLLAATLVLAACGPKIRFSDSVDNDFDLVLTHPFDDRLDTPYVAGAQFRIYAYDITEDHVLEGWTIVSSDPNVLDITSVEVFTDEIDDDDNSKSDIIGADVIATGPGVVTLEVLDEHGEFVRATEVEVMQPDRLELYAAGPMFIERDDLAGPITEAPLLLANGTATFYVKWFAGSQQLSGAGALGLASSYTQIVELWERQSYLDEDRDWVSLSFESPVDGNEIATIEFLANGEPVANVDFEIVQPEDIARVELIDESTAGADEGDLFTVLAQAYTADDRPIWAVAYDWDIDGRSETGEGDLFRYWFVPAASSVLGAQYGEHRGETIIQGNDGYVASSNDISCFCSTAAQDDPTRGLGFGVLALGLLGLVRRRR